MLRRSFPDSWGAASESLNEKFAEHFEAGMDALWQTYPAAISELRVGAPSPNLLMQDMARFFLCFSLGVRQQDSYSTLIKHLIDLQKFEAVRFATLNYEHLLEHAIARCGRVAAVLRPHGGCQMWPHRGGSFQWDGSRAIGQGYHSGASRIRRRSRQQSMDELNIAGQGGYPCMAIYVPSKRTQMGQRYLIRIQDRLRRQLQTVAQVMLIGVRPWPTDEHIWGPLIRSSASVLFVGGHDSFADLLRLRAEGTTKFIGERFHECIGAIAQAV